MCCWPKGLSNLGKARQWGPQKLQVHWTVSNQMRWFGARTFQAWCTGRRPHAGGRDKSLAWKQGVRWENRVRGEWLVMRWPWSWPAPPWSTSGSQRNKWSGQLGRNKVQWGLFCLVCSHCDLTQLSLGQCAAWWNHIRINCRKFPRNNLAFRIDWRKMQRKEH